MSDDTTARLGLPYLVAGQMQKHVTLNESLTRLDALVQTRVQSRSLDAPPAEPEPGALCLVGAAPEDDWAGFEPGDLVRFDENGWTVQGAPEGQIVLVADEAVALVRQGDDWAALGDFLGEIGELDRLGINTTADDANPFAAKLNTALWTALEAAEGGSGDLRLTLNKEAAGDVGSVLFQTGYSGRAEFGLIGTDLFGLKVSGDGVSWNPALTVDATGKVGFTRGALRRETTVLTASGSYAVPEWAVELHIECVGAGGGGGSGGTGAAGTLRTGGAGGGAGGAVHEVFGADALGDTLTITIGSGGAAGAAASGGASGSAGGSGGDTIIADGATVLLEALGGSGGAGGGAGASSGGVGGVTRYSRANSGGNGSADATGASGASITVAYAAGGGGGGGGVDAANAEKAGGVGGYGYYIGNPSHRAMRGSAGTGAAAGSAGADKAWERGFGAGGGGGGGGHAVAGGAGGSGGAPGGGGGGGGGGRSATGSGAGGVGGRGEVRITAIG